LRRLRLTQNVTKPNMAKANIQQSTANTTTQINKKKLNSGFGGLVRRPAWKWTGSILTDQGLTHSTQHKQQVE